MKRSANLRKVSERGEDGKIEIVLDRDREK